MKGEQNTVSRKLDLVQRGKAFPSMPPKGGSEMTACSQPRKQEIRWGVGEQSCRIDVCLQEENDRTNKIIATWFSWKQSVHSHMDMTEYWVNEQLW